jgi:hypothetical protein
VVLVVCNNGDSGISIGVMWTGNSRWSDPREPAGGARLIVPAACALVGTFDELQQLMIGNGDGLLSSSLRLVMS